MINLHKNKILVILLLMGVVAFGTLSFSQAPQPPRKGPSNLKVLPKNIDHSQLIAIMHNFEQALNYRCGDCHASNPADPKRLDFASDANPKKDVARHMMKMMMKLNKRYFKVKGDFAGNYVNAKYEITCYTCHHGGEHPLTFPDTKGKKSNPMEHASRQN